MHLRQTRDDAEEDILETRLRGRGDGHRVAIAAHALRDPEDVNLFHTAAVRRLRRARHRSLLSSRHRAYMERARPVSKRLVHDFRSGACAFAPRAHVHAAHDARCITPLRRAQASPRDHARSGAKYAPRPSSRRTRTCSNARLESSCAAAGRARRSSRTWRRAGVAFVPSSTAYSTIRSRAFPRMRGPRCRFPSGWHSSRSIRCSRPGAAAYPSPAGPVRADVSAGAWETFSAALPLAHHVEADIEALVVRRARDGRRECFVAPVDVCYGLVGAIRMRWKGIEGGDDVRDTVEDFFQKLRRRARPIDDPPRGTP